MLVDRLRETTPASVDDTDAWVSAETTMRAIRAALAVLPASQRDVVELVAWADLTMAEAAVTLHVSVGTVKSRLARARTRLASTPIATLLDPSQGDPS